MHIPDGFLSPPVIAATYTLSAGGLGFVWRKLRKKFDDRLVPQIAMLAAFIFVAQMINIPVSGGTSGHLMGGFLAVLFVGPYAAAFIISLVLGVQMLLFQDGGLTALGANVLNMALVGVGGSYLIFRIVTWISRKFTSSAWTQFSVIFVCSWISIEISALLCGIELGLSGLLELKMAVGVMTAVHALIGILEGIMTVFIFQAVRLVRPDLIRLNFKPGFLYEKSS